MFRVNTYQEAWQRNPDIAVFPDGTFLIVYESFVRDSDADLRLTAVLMQRYDAQGRPVGSETLVDGINGARSAEARVAVLDDGGYAVTWTYDDFGPILTTRTEVYVQAFDADGTPRTDALRVDTVTPLNDAVLPEVFATENGGFTVVYGGDSSTAKFDEVFRQTFAADGTRLGDNALVNTVEGDFDEIYARSTRLANGNTITVWNSESALDIPSADLDSNEVRGLLTDPSGAVLRQDFGLSINFGSVAGGSGSGYDVAGLANGGFALTNKNYAFEIGAEEGFFYTMLRLFDGTGTQIGAPIQVHAGERLPGDTRTVQLDTGELVVIWAQPDDTGGFKDAIYGRMFSPQGVALGTRFDVSTGVPDFTDQEAPEVAALPGGGFVVAFTSEAIDADDEGVAAVIFGRGTAGDDILSVDATGHMMGLDGNDLLLGDARANRLDGGTGQDQLFGGDLADVLLGGTGNDLLSGGTGGDSLFGQVGADTLSGGKGPDLVFGGRGADLLQGKIGPDLLQGGAGADVLLGGTGPDVLDGGSEVDTLQGQAGHDLLRGGLGADTLAGGLGHDTLQGGKGPDVVAGGQGQDLLTGGFGPDLFVFAPTWGADQILDFAQGQDRLDLTAWGFASLGALRTEAELQDTSAGLTIRFDTGDSLTISNLTTITVQAADFLF